MQPLYYLLKPSSNKIQKFIRDRTKHAPKWWTPIWNGLVADPESKHRKAMGASVWLYLYLLTYTNRKTGIARRRQSQIRKDTGYPARTIQRHLKRLVQRQYVSLTRSEHYLHVQIKKWKSFNIPHDKIS
jgi:hypothetical protein